MYKSFLRVEDWAPIIHSGINNPCWLQILRIIDEFEQLVDAEKKQIIECIEELTSKRIEMIKHFNKYKNSLKYEGEIKKQSLSVFDSGKARYFFTGYYGHIEEIMSKIGANPRLLAKILSQSHHKKFDNLDFVQSILYHLYPCYIPSIIKSYTPNNCLLFVQQIINRWSYDIKLGRPQTYTVIDQIINGFNKTPEIVCYVEKISMNFMRELNKCKMEFFAFDEQAIKHEFQLKKSAGLSYNVQKKNWKSKLKNFFSKNEEDEFAQSFYSQASETSDPSQLHIDINNIMRIRQRQFLNVVMKTIQTILNLQTPFLLNQMMRFFHNKIKKQIDEKGNKLKPKISLPAQQINKNGIFENTDQSEAQNTITRHNSQSEASQRKEYYRHYCYFIMTNLICQELHNKFTISHEDTGMKPADLQNITQIIKIMTQVFQGYMPEGDKYKNEQLQNVDAYLPKIPVFYDKILIKSQCQYDQSDSKPKHHSGGPQGEKIRQILLKLHQNTLILSFNDIRTLLSVVKNSAYLNELQLDAKTQKMQFLSDPKITNLFLSTTKRLQFHEAKHDVQKIFFVFNSRKPSTTQVIQYYIGSESPLKDLPMLTKSLMYGSNLNVTEALQVTKSLQLIQTLSFKQVKYFLKKIAARYSNLYLRDSEILSDKFRQTIELNLNRNINRKSVLLLHRDQICSRLKSTQKLIEFYTDELRSSQFYERISQAFIQNIKIKVYLRIENDQFKAYENISEMKGVHLQSLLVTDAASKSKKLSQQYILRKSFKTFTSIPELLSTLVRNNITRQALAAGRRVEEFNEMFNKLCAIIVSYIEQFMKKREILQNLNKDKLKKTIVSKIQNYIYEKAKETSILNDDKKLIQARKKIDAEMFFQKDLQQLKVDWSFLCNEGQKKFKLMMEQTSIIERIRHFQQMFEMVFIILAFSMSNNKITAQVINPVMQFLILVSPINKHYQCLYCLQTLKWNTNAKTPFNITLYQSSLSYIVNDMINDYQLKKNLNEKEEEEEENISNYSRANRKV